MSAIGSVRISHPIHIQGRDPKGRWNVSLMEKADVPEMVQLLTQNAFEFYRDGKPFTKDEAEKHCQKLCRRTADGIPFSGFAVRDASGKLIGSFAIGFDTNPRKLHIGAIELKKYHNQGFGREVMHWVLHEMIPALDRAGIRIPVMNEKKEVVEWLDMEKSAIVATVHPDHTHCNNLLVKAGFKLQNTTVIAGFQGSHDSRRNVYELAIRELLHK